MAIQAAALLSGCRRHGGLRNTIVTKVDDGAALVVRGRNATGDWLQVQAADATDSAGWVAAQYVTFNGDINALPVST